MIDISPSFLTSFIRLERRNCLVLIYRIKHYLGRTRCLDIIVISNISANMQKLPHAVSLDPSAQSYVTDTLLV